MKFAVIVGKTKVLCQVVLTIERALLSRLFRAEFIIVALQVLSVRLKLAAKCTGGTSNLGRSVWSASVQILVRMTLVLVCQVYETYCQLSKLR